MKKLSTTEKLYPEGFDDPVDVTITWSDCGLKSTNPLGKKEHVIKDIEVDVPGCYMDEVQSAIVNFYNYPQIIFEK